MYSYNERLLIHYPSSTLVESDPTWKPRRIIVKRVRDLVTDPLTVDDFLRRPLIRRGRWLIFGRDEETGQLRQFYQSTTKEEFRELPLRVALYEPFGAKPVKLLSRPFAPTRRDRILLGRAVALWSRQNFGEMRLTIFADDLRRVG